jgi:hypothetical protein
LLVFYAAADEKTAAQKPKKVKISATASHFFHISPKLQNIGDFGSTNRREKFHTKPIHHLIFKTPSEDFRKIKTPKIISLSGGRVVKKNLQKALVLSMPVGLQLSSIESPWLPLSESNLCLFLLKPLLLRFDFTYTCHTNLESAVG